MVRRNQGFYLNRDSEDSFTPNMESLSSPDNCENLEMGYPVYLPGTGFNFCNISAHFIVLTISLIIVAIIVGLGITCHTDRNTSNKQLDAVKKDIQQLKYDIETVSRDIHETTLSVEKIMKFVATLKNVLPNLSESTINLKTQIKQGSKLRNYLKEINRHTGKIIDTILEAAEPIQEIIRSGGLSADRTGKVDFALESTGGRVINTRNAETYTQTSIHSFLGIPFCEKGNPQAIIQPGVYPGQCWAFKGSSGSAIIQLIGSIYVTSITMEHIPIELSPTGSISSAPRLFSLWGLKSEEDLDGFFFGQFTYDKNGPPLQTFHVQHESKVPYTFVELKVISNHGEEKYTCIYRVRIHGNLASLS